MATEMCFPRDFWSVSMESFKRALACSLVTANSAAGAVTDRFMPATVNGYVIVCCHIFVVEDVNPGGKRHMLEFSCLNFQLESSSVFSS